MTGSLAYVLSKTFTTKSIEGISGTLAGKNATISDVQKVDGVTTVTFKWTADNGDTRTTQIQVADGETPEITITPITGGHRVTFTTDGTPQTVDIMDGVSVVSAEIKSNNHLELTLSDGTKIDCGEIVSAKELDDLTDVNLGTLSDGDVLSYDESSGKWINREINYEIAVEDLTDVNINKATLVDGDIIKWDATAQKWVKGQIPTIESLDDIGDVDLTTPTDGQILVYDDTDDKWKNIDNTIVADIDDLGDVDIDTTTLENGQILKYDSVSHKWVNGNASATSTKIEDLADVSVDTATLEDGMVLVWDATNQVWVNQQGGGVVNKLDDIGDVQFANLHDGDMIKYDAINHVWFNIGMDNAPTQNSDNLLDSNAVYQSEKLIKDKMGDLSQLDTTIKSDLVNAINEVKSDGGDLSTLTTDDKTSLVGAINEVDAHADENKTNIGTLANLTTTDKTNIVRAVNEIDANFKGLKYVEQVTALGNPEDKANKVVQYVGASSGDLVRGYFYYSAPSIDQGVVIYTWEQLSIQPTNNDYDNLINKPEIAGVELSGDKSLDDLGINGKFQYDVLPTATSALTGKVVQYIGGTTADYTTNYFYQCVYDGDTSSYVWKNVDVSSNTELLNRIITLETNQGDMTQLTIPSVTDLVGAINVLAVRGIKSITYAEPYLTITLMDDSTFQFDITVILNATEIGQLGNVIDSTVQNTNTLAYDSSILKYKPYDVVGALTTTLQSAKDYTDTEIGKINLDDAFYCDAKPSISYDSSAGKYIVVYYQATQVHTSTDISARYYYKDSNNDPYCTSWFLVDNGGTQTPVELTYLLSSVNLDDFVNKNTDVVSTYTIDMADKTKIPNIASMDALYALVATALGLKVNTSDIVDNLISDDATVPLSAKQGKVLKGLVDTKQNIIQYDTLPQVTAQMVTDNVIYQYVGADSQAYKNGRFYKASYDQAQDIYYWQEVKFSADYDAQVLEGSTNAPQGGAVYTALQDKQDKTLETAIAIEGTTETTVEGALGGLNSRKARKFQVSTMPTASADLLNVCLLYIGTTTATYEQGCFYTCELVSGSDPAEYTWNNITPKVISDATMSITSTNPIQNKAITGGLQALQNGVIVVYPDEASLLDYINYSAGQIVSIGTIAYCVSERTWYKVTAIDSSTLAITWSPYNPHIGGEVTEGDAIHVDDSDGSVNVVTDNTTTFISTTNYYAWKNSSDNLVFTKSATPNIGDTVYDETATAISDTVEAYDSSNATIDVNSVIYDRNSASDFHTTAVSGLAPNSEDFVVSGNTFGLSVDQRSYTGTRAGFNSLTPQQKSRVRILNITDEAGQGVTVVNTVANNNMNPVTSNAVFNFAIPKTLNPAITLGDTQYTDAVALLNEMAKLLNKTAYWHQEA